MTRMVMAWILILLLTVAALPGAAAGQEGLIDHRGQPMTERDLGPDLRLIFFGYTACPDACPVSLQTISDALDALGAHGDRITPVFVTIDPDRDTATALAEYVSMFHPRFIGVTGALPPIAALAERYGVQFRRVDVAADNAYAIDHTTTIFFADRDGKVHGRFPHDLAPRELAKRILQRLAQMP